MVHTFGFYNGLQTLRENGSKGSKQHAVDLMTSKWRLLLAVVSKRQLFWSWACFAAPRISSIQDNAYLTHLEEFFRTYNSTKEK